MQSVAAEKLDDLPRADEPFVKFKTFFGESGFDVLKGKNKSITVTGLTGLSTIFSLDSLTCCYDVVDNGETISPAFTLKGINDVGKITQIVVPEIIADEVHVKIEP